MSATPDAEPPCRAREEAADAEDGEDFDELEVGYDIPARPGMAFADI